MLELQGVSRMVGGRVHIHPTQLTLLKGTMNVLLGPTLSGKTSLMRLMAGLDQPTAGRVIWDGQDVTGMAPHLLARRGMSRTFQNLQIFQSMTVLENAIAGYHLQERGPVGCDIPCIRRPLLLHLVLE